MRHDLIAIGIVLLIAGSVLTLVEFDLTTRGESRLFAAMTPGVLDPTVDAAAQRYERMIPVLMWFSYEPVPMAAYAESGRNVMAMASGLVTAYGGRIRRVLPLLRVCALDVPMENRELFAMAAGVRGVAYDTFVKVHSAGYLEIEEVASVSKIEELWNQGWTGEGTTVAVLDSGSGPDADVATSAIEGGTPEDRYGHGTSVQHIIRELAPDAKIVSIAVLNELGCGRISDILAGLEEAVKENADLINLSLGASPSLVDSLAWGCETIVRQFNVAIFASAGNDPSYVASPARSPLVVGVGAVGTDLCRADYSATGDIWAVGDQYIMWGGAEQPGRGTSFASPVAIAIYADYMSGHPEVEPWNTDELATLLEGAEKSPENLSLASGMVVDVDPIPETPLVIKILPYLLLLMAGAGITFVAVSWEKLSVSRLIPKVT